MFLDLLLQISFKFGDHAMVFEREQGRERESPSSFPEASWEAWTQTHVVREADVSYF